MVKVVVRGSSIGNYERERRRKVRGGGDDRVDG